MVKNLPVTRETRVRSLGREDPLEIRSVPQSCPTLCDPMNCSTPRLPVHHQLPEFTQTHIHGVSDAIHHLILCRPLLLLPPIPPSIIVFSNESTLRMRWPKYWSFSFSIIPSKEIPGLISFRMDWLDLLAVQGPLKSLLQHHSSKSSILRHSKAVGTPPVLIFLWSKCYHVWSGHRDVSESAFPRPPPPGW